MQHPNKKLYDHQAYDDAYITQLEELRKLDSATFVKLYIPNPDEVLAQIFEAAKPRENEHYHERLRRMLAVVNSHLAAEAHARAERASGVVMERH